MKIKVVMLEPDKKAYVAEIDNSLEGMQKAVDGLIQPFYPFEEEVCIICNEEGKINGLPLNRAVYNDSGKMVDVICGTAFVCDCLGEHFGSLNDELLKRYCEMFECPEIIFKYDGEIVVMRCVNP